MKIYGYLKNATGRRESIVISPEYISYISVKGSNTADWMEIYPGATEYIDEGIPETQGQPLSNMVYFYYYHSHDQVTRQSISGVIFLFG